jgi:general L-amino acid transport system permease protein
MLSLLRNQKVRGILFQLLTVIGLVAFLWYIGVNTIHNIEQRGIRTGFAFLDTTAGFAINESPIPYTETSTYWTVFEVGVLNTLIVSFWAIILSTILGLIIGVARLSKNWLIAKLASAYIDTFRNIPILLQILFWYNVVLATLPPPRKSMEFLDKIFLNNRGFIVPRPIFGESGWFILAGIIAAILIVYFINRWLNKRQEETGEEFFFLPWGILIVLLVPYIFYLFAPNHIVWDIPKLHGFNFKGGKVFSPEFLALAFALTIYTATFIAEAIRSGIEAVKKGQKEAAASIGLTPYQSLKLVILPQAIRIAIPPTINQYLNVVKNSSLATAIGYPEVVTVFAGTALNQVGQAIEMISMTMAVYLVISLIVSAILNFINHKMKIKER